MEVLNTLTGPQVTGIVAIIGTLIGLITYWKTFRVKRPFYLISSENVVKKEAKPSGLKFTYNGQPIDSLTISRVYLWNGGNDTLNSMEEAPADPLTISINEQVRLLESQIESFSSKANDLRLERDANRIRVRFDYLDGSHGCVIRLIHTGLDSTVISVGGTFKGVGPIQEQGLAQSRVYRYFLVFKKHKVFIVLTASLIIFFPQLLWFGLEKTSLRLLVDESKVETITIAWSGSLLAVFYAFMGLVFLKLQTRGRPDRTKWVTVTKG